MEKYPRKPDKDVWNRMTNDPRRSLVLMETYAQEKSAAS